MKLYRSLLGVARSGVHPREIAVAVLLGVLAGFVQGWNLALGVVLLAALAFKAPWKMFMQAWAAAFGLAWALTPLTFRLGHYLLSDTPVGEWLEPHADGVWVVLFDLDRYTLLGGLLLAPLVALPAAVAVSWSTHLLQTRFQALQQKIQANQHWQASRSIRFACWLLLGSMAKAKQSAPAARWFRPMGLGVTGVVFVPLLAGTWFYLPSYLQGGVLRGLSTINQAEVNAQQMDLSLSDGVLSIEGLRMADPRNLDQDRLRVDQLTAVLKPGPLLRGRVLVQQVRVDGLACDLPRERRAKPYAFGLPGFDNDEEPAEPPPEPSDSTFALSEYMPEWKQLEARLQQLKQLLERVEKLAARPEGAKPRPAGDDPRAIEAAAGDDDETLGYGQMRSRRHTFGPVSPRVWVQEIQVTRLSPQWGLGEDASIQLMDLASDPRLTRKPVRVLVAARDGQLKLDTQFNVHRPGTPHSVALEARDLPLQKAINPAKLTDALRVSGGKLTLSGKGTITSRQIDLPLRIAAKDLDVKLGGDQPMAGLPADLWNQGLAKLGGLDVQSRLTGGWRSPRLRLNAKELTAKFQEQLKAAGHDALAQTIERQLASAQEKAKDAIAKAKDRAEKFVENNALRGVAIAQDTVKSEVERNAQRLSHEAQRGHGLAKEWLKDNNPLDKLGGGASGLLGGDRLPGAIGSGLPGAIGNGTVGQAKPAEHGTAPPPAAAQNAAMPGAPGGYAELRSEPPAPRVGYPDPYGVPAGPSPPASGSPPLPYGANNGLPPIPGTSTYNPYPPAAVPGGSRGDSPYPPLPPLTSNNPPSSAPAQDRAPSGRDAYPAQPHPNSPYPNAPYSNTPSPAPGPGGYSPQNPYPSTSSPYLPTYPLTDPGNSYPVDSHPRAAAPRNSTNPYSPPASPHPTPGATPSEGRDASGSGIAGTSGGSYDFYEDDSTPPPSQPYAQPGAGPSHLNPTMNAGRPGSSLGGPPLPQNPMVAPGAVAAQPYDPSRGVVAPQPGATQGTRPQGVNPQSPAPKFAVAAPQQGNEWRVTRWARGAKDGVSGMLFGSSQPASSPPTQPPQQPTPPQTQRPQQQPPPQGQQRLPPNFVSRNPPQQSYGDTASDVQSNDPRLARRPPPSPRPGMTGRQSQNLPPPQTQTAQDSKPWYKFW